LRIVSSGFFVLLLIKYGSYVRGSAEEIVGSAIEMVSERAEGVEVGLAAALFVVAYCQA